MHGHLNGKFFNYIFNFFNQSLKKASSKPKHVAVFS